MDYNEYRKGKINFGCVVPSEDFYENIKESSGYRRWYNVTYLCELFEIKHQIYANDVSNCVEEFVNWYKGEQSENKYNFNDVEIKNLIVEIGLHSIDFNS